MHCNVFAIGTLVQTIINTTIVMFELYIHVLKIVPKMVLPKLEQLLHLWYGPYGRGGDIGGQGAGVPHFQRQGG